MAHLVVGRHQDTATRPVANIAGFGSRFGHLTVMPYVSERHDAVCLSVPQRELVHHPLSIGNADYCWPIEIILCTEE